MSKPLSPFIEFASDPKKRTELLAVLANPTFAEAIEIIDEMMEPKIGTQADVQPMIAAAKCHQVAGKNHFKTLLKRMTKEPTAREKVAGRSLAETADDVPENFK